jgi:hypothetical protein
MELDGVEHDPVAFQNADIHAGTFFPLNFVSITGPDSCFF